MTARLAKAFLHLIGLVIFSLGLLWLLFFCHITGLNSLFIPDLLRRQNGAESQYIVIWYALSCIMSYLEWFGLLWLINKFNYWYGRAWLTPAQMWVAKIATVAVGFVTAICIVIFYVTLFVSRWRRLLLKELQATYRLILTLNTFSGSGRSACRSRSNSSQRHREAVGF